LACGLTQKARATLIAQSFVIQSEHKFNKDKRSTANGLKQRTPPRSLRRGGAFWALAEALANAKLGLWIIRCLAARIVLKATIGSLIVVRAEIAFRESLAQRHDGDRER
jgi:hypothetical protein